MSEQRKWRQTPDGFRILVPSTWEVPGAGAAPTSPNRGLAEGQLESKKASVAELVAGDAELTGGVFRAHGKTKGGEATGVAVGIYEIGTPITLDFLRQEISRAAPGAQLDTVTIATFDGLRMTPVATDTTGRHGRHVVSDYWVAVPNRPGHFALVRFWRDGNDSGDDASGTHQYMASAFAFMLPVHWSGVNRPPALSMFAPPAEDTPKEGAWRLAGWRLGTVFHTKVLRNATAGAAGVTPRRGDLAWLLLVFACWLPVAVGFGFERNILLLGGLSFMGAVASAQKVRLKAVAGLVIILGMLLALGLAMD